MFSVRKHWILFAAAGLFWLSGTVCAQDAADDGSSSGETESWKEEEPNRDPFEGFNRAIFTFNDNVDRAIFQPVARVYKKVLPDPVETGITNFFSNLNDVPSAANNLLQGRINAAFSDMSRVIINSTVGVLGFIDVASRNGIPKRGEDLGETLGVWGFGSGPYLVLPFLGPSSVRDTVGLVADFAIDPVHYVEDDWTRYSLYGLRFIDRRAAYLDATDIAAQAALDPYIFYREAYLQKRASDVRNGSATDDF